MKSVRMKFTDVFDIKFKYFTSPKEVDELTVRHTIRCQGITCHAGLVLYEKWGIGGIIPAQWWQHDLEIGIDGSSWVLLGIYGLEEDRP